MDKEIEYDELDIENEEEIIDEPELGEDDEDGVDYKAKFLEEKERREKAEKAIIKSKEKKQEPRKDTNKVTAKDYQLDILRVQGVTDDELERIKRISAFEEIDIIKAFQSEDFKLWKEKREQDEKSRQSSMPASKRGTLSKETLEDVKRRVMSGKATPDDYKRLRSK